MRDDKGLGIFLILIMLLTLCGVAYTILGTTVNAFAVVPRMEPLTATFTSEGDSIKAYILVDPDTQQQYIVTDKGGITPRLEKEV